MTDYPQAMSAIKAQFYTAWVAGSAAIAGYVPEIRWADNELAPLPDGSKIWCRHSVQSVFEEQTNVSVCDPALGKRRYTNTGLVFVQIFIPKTLANGDSLANQLAVLARNCYRGKVATGEVWFRNARINNIPPEDLYYRRNAVSEYEFDEIA